MRACDELAGLRLRRRLAPLLERAGAAGAAGVTGAVTASTAGAAPSESDFVSAPAGVVRRRRRLRDVDAAGVAGSGPETGAGIEAA